MPTNPLRKFGLLWLALVALGGACTPAGAPASPTATAVTVISRDRAIEIGTQACRLPHLVLMGEPRNVRAQLVTLGEADQLTGSSRADQPLSTLVWLVQMDGTLQLIGGPPTAAAPPPGQTLTTTPPQPFQGTCSATVNAQTGDRMTVRDWPLATPPTPAPTATPGPAPTEGAQPLPTLAGGPLRTPQQVLQQLLDVDCRNAVYDGVTYVLAQNSGALLSVTAGALVPDAAPIIQRGCTSDRGDW